MRRQRVSRLEEPLDADLSRGMRKTAPSVFQEFRLFAMHSPIQPLLRWTRIPLSLLAMIAVCALTSPPARACSCVDTSKSEAESIKSSFKWAGAVFIGTPVEVTVQKRVLQLGDRTIPYDNYHVRFAVKESFKGITTDYAVSDTGSGGGDCSYGKMEVGRDYLIYAMISGDSYVEFRGCNPTHMLPSDDWKRERKRAAKELALLRKLSRSR
jgi:hypothetical protein